MHLVRDMENIVPFQEMMSKSEKCFIVKETCKMLGGHIEIIVDTKTGVNYICKNQGFVYFRTANLELQI